MRRLGALIACGLLAARAGAETAPASLRRDLDRILDQPALASAFCGLEVRSLKTGRVLYARNADKAFRPASTLKLVTTAAALDALGPEARVRTTVETTGRLDGLGRILGDLYLVGRGDPSLGGGRYGSEPPLRAFEEMAEALRAAGVKRVEGQVIGHEGFFTGERKGSDWTWEDLVWSYGAEISALNFNDNAIDLRLEPGEQPTDPAVLEVSPPSRYYRVVSTAVTAAPGTKTALTLTREPGSNVIRLAGAIAVGEERWHGWVAVEDPARFAASVFTETLEARGIRVAVGVATSSAPLPAGMCTLAAHESAPLAELVKGVNKESRNLHAEALLRLLGAHVKGEGSAAAGLLAVGDFLSRVGARPDAFGLRDGSGLSRTNVVTPAALVQVLVAMDRHPSAAAFRDSLPVAGADGTLADRLKGTAAAGRVLAKTGTLALANALAGYVTTARGERLAFAAVVNHHQRPKDAVGALDAIAALLASR